MGEMADYYQELAMMEDMQYQCSDFLQNRTKRYDVSDEQIREALFVTSTKDLCQLADKVLMEYYPEDSNDDYEMNKVINIAAFGLSKKFLTDKQKWYLASFCIYYIQNPRDVESVDPEDEDMPF